MFPVDILAVRSNAIYSDVFAGIAGIYGFQRICREFFCLFVVCLHIKLEQQCRYHTSNRRIIVHRIVWHLQNILILAQHIIFQIILIDVQHIRQRQAKHQQQICKQDANQQDAIVSDILKNHAQAEPMEKRNFIRQPKRLFPTFAPQISAQKLQWRQFQLSAQNHPGQNHHHKHRNNRCQHECFTIPDRHIGRQAVASIIHTRTIILHK